MLLPRAPAGAPGDPDQNWGFPPYNWDEMHRDGCRWWRRRLKHMEQYFHAYRIDHVLGFFRMCASPPPPPLPSPENGELRRPRAARITRNPSPPPHLGA